MGWAPENVEGGARHAQLHSKIRVGTALTSVVEGRGTAMRWSQRSPGLLAVGGTRAVKILTHGDGRVEHVDSLPGHVAALSWHATADAACFVAMGTDIVLFVL